MKDGAVRDATWPLATRVLQHVLLPLALTWLAGTVITLAIAYFFTQRAFDNSLLDDAYMLASNVRLEGGELRLAMSEREVRTALFDQAEAMRFSVRRPDGSAVAGDAEVDAAPVVGDPPWRFGSRTLDGERLRLVALRRDGPAPFQVVVVQTTRERSALLEQLLFYSLAPQLLLLGLLAIWLRGAVAADLAPLRRLQRELEQRGASDLAPVAVQAQAREIERLAQAINALLARLERSVRAQREFAGDVAHGLRTPLAGIRALAEYGLAQKEPAAWREQLERIGASQESASRLVDRLLGLAMAREAHASLRLEPVALDELVRAAVLRFLPRADAAHVDLGAQGIDGPSHVRGDATLVESILDNLLDNALRYGSDAADGKAAVTVSVERAGDRTLLTVQDNGPGHPDEEQAGLMRRGAQGLTGQLLGQGAGLGLALVAQYAALMEAQVRLGSGPEGKGWACTVEFASAD